MNVAEMMLTGRFTGAERDPEGVRQWQAMIANSPRIEIQNIVDAFRLLPRDWFPTVSVAPPWAEVTLFFYVGNIKFAIFSQSCLVSASGKQTILEHVKSDLRDLDVEKSLECWPSGFAIRNYVYVSEVGAPAASFLGMNYQFLDEDGFPVKRGLVHIEKGLLREPSGEPMDLGLLSRLFFNLSVYQLIAFSFCHCKNVELVSAPVSRQVRRNAQRRNQPVFEHHHIVIDPIRRVLNNSGGFSQHGDVLKAMHICRGHFARYGEQYGTGKLFGKHEGTFWVSQHVRGKLERGVVTKDYALKAGAGK